MARKKAPKPQQQTTLVPPRTQNLSALLEGAKSGDSAQAVKAYLDAGGSVAAHVRGAGPVAVLQVPLLQYMASYNPHPHTELAECVKLLVEAGADIDAKVIAASDDGIYSTVLSGADVWEKSSAKGMTVLHHAASAALTDSCELLLTKESSLVHAMDVNGSTALPHA
eukprot:14449-Heterococcus_DN1.PRE.1